MKRIEIAILVGLVCSVCLSAFTAFAGECGEIRGGVVRLHILANSDSGEDQALKLEVRDAILAGTGETFAAARTKEQAVAAAGASLGDIAAIAEEEIARHGYDYGVSARLVNRYFDTREYDGFTMPAGRYDAVQVEIGAGGGKNWWCVMFPPLCLPAAEKSDLPLEEQIRALGERPVYKPAFAVVELIESLAERQYCESRVRRPSLKGDIGSRAKHPPVATGTLFTKEGGIRSRALSLVLIS
jgi:stage II sporulation protein R